MLDNYKKIQYKLRKFRFKLIHYELFKSFFILTSIIIGSLFVFSLFELFFYFKSSTKNILVLLLLLIYLLSFIMLILIPVVNILYKKGRYSDIDLANLLRDYFPEFKDKLQNILELKGLKEHTYSIDLINASIEQKAAELIRYDFNDALHFKRLSNHIIVFLGIVILSFGSFELIVPFKDASLRLVDYNTNYSKPSPYSYEILNEELSIGKGDNYKLVIRFIGNEDIDDIQIVYGNSNYFMVNDSSNIYSYQFNMVNNSIDFQFLTNQYYTEKYKLQVLPKPLLSKFSSIIHKPTYTNLKEETIENNAQLVVPEGSTIEFIFTAFDTDSIVINENESYSVIQISEDDKFLLNKQFIKNSNFSVDLNNEFFSIKDAVSFDIEIIKDEYPIINVIGIKDSTDLNSIYFKGNLSDDYGFSNLEFVTRIQGQEDSTISLSINSNVLDQDFFYAYNFSSYQLVTNSIEYFFRVSDNDRINGFKSTVSEVFVFSFPDDKTFFEYQDSSYNNIEEIINRSKQLSNEIQSDLKELQTKMINNEISDWERKSAMKDIYSKKQKLQDVVDQLQSKNEEISNYLNSFSEQNQELVKKQEQIEDLLENVLSDELKELMEEFNKMVEKFNESKMNELQQKIDISLDDLNKQLDKNLEVLRKMQVEQKLDQISEKLENILNQQEQTLEDFDDLTEEQITENQEKLKRDTETLQEEYEQLNDLNEQLENPMNMMDFKQEFEEIKEEFENTIQKNMSSKHRKAKKSAEQNQQNISDLTSMLQQMQSNMFAEQDQVNLALLMQVLDNLVIFSIEQEQVINSDLNSPFINEILVKQEQLKQNFRVVEDSLYSISKQVPMIGNAVNEEIVAINQNFQLINSELSDGSNVNISRYQQQIMTSANNLALFLSEVIKQMQNQMASSSPGDQNCEKPGNNPNPNSSGSMMKQLQKSMEQQLGKMMQMMKDGASPGEMNRELGKSLSQQEMMQNALRQLMNQGQVGSSSYETLKEADQLLNEMKNDILRSNISNQTINRNKQILTRLLEAENAEQERDLDEQRKSNTAEQQYIKSAEKYFENISSTEYKEENLLKKQLYLQNFYQKKYKNYINQLDSISGK